MEEDTKPWWQSRVIWGAVVSMVGGLVSIAFGIAPDESTLHETTEICANIATGIGALIAMYGRLHTTKAISGSPAARTLAERDAVRNVLDMAGDH